MRPNKIIKDAFVSIGIFVAAVILSILFQKLDVSEHITTIFVFAVFLISLLTEGYCYGIASSIGGMLAVNYAFTYPYFTAENMTHIFFRVFTSGQKVIFEIADDGCGINEDKLKHIFSGSFESSGASADAQKRNAGIGLSVCATIIKAHNGDISAENRKSGGALFRFILKKGGMTDDE